jgi:hypothetical protein
MGLDQYLEARKYIDGNDYTKVGSEVVKKQNPEYENVISAVGLTMADIETDFPSATLSVQVGYWRKANQIHEWFVTNVQNGEDDCKAYYVEPDTLVELHRLCLEVLDDNSKAETLLPVSAGGFFFGSYEYDEYYFEQLKDTAEMIRKILDNPKLATGWDFYYQSSW